MNKVIAAVIASSLAIALAGCGKKETTPGEKLDGAIESTQKAAEGIDLDKVKADTKAAAEKAEKEAKEAAKAAQRKAKEAAEAAEREAKEAAEATEKAAKDAKQDASKLINSFKD